MVTKQGIVSKIKKYKAWILTAAIIVLPGGIPIFAAYKLFQHLRRKKRADEFDPKDFLKRMREELRANYKKGPSD